MHTPSSTSVDFVETRSIHGPDAVGSRLCQSMAEVMDCERRVICGLAC